MTTEIFFAALFVYEYWRREQRHRMVIDRVKQDLLPEVDVQKESTFGFVTTGIFTVMYIAFILFLTYFVFISGKLKTSFPVSILSGVFLLGPYGIGVLLVLITRRNLKKRTAHTDMNERNGQ